MPDFADIRSAIAANLRTALPADEGQVAAYLLDAPTTVCLQVAGIERMELTDFGGGRDYTILIEGYFPVSHDIAAQKSLDELVEAMPDAIEQALTSRLVEEDGTIQTGQTEAGAIAFLEYRGATRSRVENGSDVLLAIWAVRVQT